MRTLHPEHQLIAFALGLHRLGCELRLIGDESNLGRDGKVGTCIEHNAGIIAYFGFAHFRSGQIDVHVDVGEIEHREDFTASRKNLADIGNPILDAAVSRRAERVIGNVDFVQLNILLSRIEGALGYCHPEVRRVQSRGRRIDLLSTLIEQFRSRMSSLHQRLSAVELLLCQRQLALLLRHVGASLIECTLGSQHLSFRLLQRGLEISRVHARDNLPRFHHIAFINKEFGDAACKFGGNIDLVGFEPAIA